APPFQWLASAPLVDVSAHQAEADPWVSIKDPTVVFHEGKWHVFATLRMRSGKVDIVYFNFTDWDQVNEAERHVLGLHDKYYCAPQVFWFSPHQKWYLVYQLAEPSRTPAFGPCYSTSSDLSDPTSWTAPRPMITEVSEKPKWLDFWVICDREKAHLFYTSLDGHLWRRETVLADFPLGWSEQTLALKADLFEASHTYKIQGREAYLTIVEAQAPGRRYYKAYLADRLEGPWRGLADTLKNPFAARENVSQSGSAPWTDCVSHGELLRASNDEYCEIDPGGWRFLFQGASGEEYAKSGGYGKIPWRLGVLELLP
ncbi:MAG: hypothetical protein KDM64_18385, partial [Verrucomicrobiae bacterium]|nr:hypothetical protein [Verrucomicrobiae bacterium]